MPTTLELGDNRATTPIPPAPSGQSWRAFAIHPESLVDTVIVDGQVLGVGSIVYAGGQPKLDLVRGVVTGGLLDPTNRGGSEVNNRLTLIAWSDCEQPTAPGPRAPFVADVPMLDAGATAVSLPAGTWKRAVRLPFQGRRHARFTMYTPAANGNFNVRVRGVTYLPRRLGLATAFEGVEPLQDEAGTVNWTNTTSPTNGDPLSLTLHVGGTDSAEAYDELQLWIQNNSGGLWVPGAAQGLFVGAEAFGDRAP